MSEQLIDIIYLLFVGGVSILTWEMLLRPTKRARLVNKTIGQTVADGLTVKVDAVEPGTYRGYMTNNKVTFMVGDEAIAIETNTQVAPRTIPVIVSVSEDQIAEVKQV
jgi:hypothetical protein